MAIKTKDIERVSGPYVTKKFQFIYTDFYPVRGGKVFYLVYTKDKKKKYVDAKFRLIVPIVDRSPFTVYINTKQNVEREVYLRPFKLVITNRIRKAGSVVRYFAKYLLSESQPIFEINKSNFSIQTNFYEKVFLPWVFTGNKEKVEKENESSLQVAEGTMEGIRYFLHPLQFYEEEDLTEYEKIQEKLSRLKFPVESGETYSGPPPGWSAGDGPPPGYGY